MASHNADNKHAAPAHGSGSGHGKGLKKHHGGHGGGAHEEHEGAPEWLISFADMVMLIMGFFVILFAMNLKEPTSGGIGGVDENERGAAPNDDPPTGAAKPTPEQLDLAIAIRAAFKNPVDLTSNDPNDQVLIRRLLDRMGPSKAETDGPPGRDSDVQSIKPTDFYTLCGRITFADFSAELTDESRKSAADIARHLKGRTLMIEVRGHASALEGRQSPDRGTRLAFDRAVAVATILEQNGIEWRQLRLTSSGHHDRLNPFPSDEREDLANARVEVILTEQVIPSREPTAPR